MKQILLSVDFSHGLESMGPESDSVLDQRLREQAELRLSDRRFQKMFEFRRKLPSYDKRHVRSC